MTEIKAPARAAKKPPADPDAIREMMEANGTYVSPLREPDPISEESDQSLVHAAVAVFQEDVVMTPEIEAAIAAVPPAGVAVLQDGTTVDTVTGEISHPAQARFKPGRKEMTKVDGGDYLTVRRRIMWMRGEPGEHPDWGIHTQLVKLDMGEWDGKTFTRQGRKSVPTVIGGIAVVHAEVIDEKGRVIAHGTAHERSELFADFIEKAETAAIGRAMAVAGYGTETAIELEEEDNVADAPVRGGRGRGSGAPEEDEGPRPIVIESSAVPGVQVGGRDPKVTQAQLREIGKLSRSLKLGPEALEVVIVNALGLEQIVWVEEATKAQMESGILAQLQAITNDQAGTLIQVLMNATGREDDGG